MNQYHLTKNQDFQENQDADPSDTANQQEQPNIAADKRIRDNGE